MPHLSRTPLSRRLDRGFTLIELLVTIAIVGILAAVAYPSYTQHVVKSNRAAAQAHLMEIAQLQQQYLAENRAYATTLADLNNLSTPTAVSRYYDIIIENVAAGPPPTFTVRAAPRTGGAQVGDGALSINQAGAKSPSGKW